ncbi:Uncharacterised protein [Vibrio cholerae]|nr:Uncharacterised protein [Vibrio cholerae]CSI66875.1 Uncharacterised protein [Vibrio cholerae]
MVEQQSEYWLTASRRGIGVIAVSINRFAQCHRDTT